jgi:shikimate kinase
MKNNIVLCGFMGSGKTTIGKLLAKELRFCFVDTDALIEQSEGKKISDIFAEFGEEYFREIESKTVKEISLKTNTVIATGGGVVLSSKNTNALKQNGLVVLLKITPEEALKRLKDDTSRPLLMRPDKKQAVKSLLSLRQPAYISAADVVVDASENPQKTVQKILQIFNAQP